MDVAGKNVSLDIDPCPFGVGAKERFSHRDGDNRETETLLHHLVDGKTHPVDGNRSFGRYQGDELRIDADDDIIAVAVVGDGSDGADRIDMPLDDMPFEAFSHLHRRFDVDTPF